MLVMSVFLALFAAVRSDAWEVNPSEFRYDMSLFFSLPEEFEDLNQYEIGAFIDGKCCGLAEKVDLPGGGSCLYMRIRSNTTSGEVSFKWRNRSTGKENEIKKKDGTSFTFSPNALEGSPSVPEPFIPYFTVKVSSYNTSQGTVKMKIGDGDWISGNINQTLPYNTEITVDVDVVPNEAVPKKFVNWSDGCDKSKHDLTVNKNIDLIAYFAGTSNATPIVTFIAIFNGEEIEVSSGKQPQGLILSAPEAPYKEGYKFDGWDNLPAKVEAGNKTYYGYYSKNTYTVTCRIDGETIATVSVLYEETIKDKLPVVEEREGYKFSGWKGLPEVDKMPAHDIVIEGNYSIESFKAVYKIGDEVIDTLDIKYGADIPEPGVPVIEGHSFNGWKKDYDKMPAHDIEIFGSYSINSYKVTFMVDDKVIETKTLEFGAEVVAPEAPVKEGYVFSKWEGMYLTMPAQDIVVKAVYIEDSKDNYTLTFEIDGKVIGEPETVRAGTPITPPEVAPIEGYSFVWQNLPETMPYEDLTVKGVHTVLKFTLTFKAGEDVVKTESLEYGATIVAPAEPEKEGYTFSGWGSFPETMPAHDLEVKGSYTINTYKVAFLIDDVEFQSMELEYGATIVAPEVVAPEGYTFSGWGEVPATMPAHDLKINGTYTANIYKVTFKIGDDIISEEEVAFNTTITVPDAPEKEGYTFAGWGEVPATMPAGDIVIEGSYTVNSYTVTFKIGADIISEEKVEYGAAITVPEAPAKEGYTFAGWGEVPKTMPAGDLVIEGSYTVNS